MGPLVTIGMPVRNGERYLSEAFGSLLAQDFEDFRLVVSDNASNDATGSMCRSLAESDGRIEYLRTSEDIGAAANFNLLLADAATPYFMWAAHDDVWEPSYLSSCVEQLQRSPHAVSCATAVQLIDASNREIAPPQSGEGLSSEDWATRVATIVARRDQHLGFGVYALHRTGLLRRVGGHGNGFGADVILSLRLAKMGRWSWIPQPLFRYRIRSPEQRVVRQPASSEAKWASRLVGDVWRELGRDSPGWRDSFVARLRFARAVARPGSGWHGILLKQNGDSLSAAVARRDVVGGFGHGCERLLLDPSSLLRRRGWEELLRARSLPADWGES